MDVRKKKTEEMKMKKRYLALALAAVLAIGYGTVKKRDLTGSVAPVSNE